MCLLGVDGHFLNYGGLADGQPPTGGRRRGRLRRPLLTTGDLGAAVEYGAAHGALAMTTPGDTSMANLKEVEGLVRGGGARVQR